MFIYFILIFIASICIRKTKYLLEKFWKKLNCSKNLKLVHRYFNLNQYRITKRRYFRKEEHTYTCT